jgi:hypothetical protein
MKVGVCLLKGVALAEGQYAAFIRAEARLPVSSEPGSLKSVTSAVISVVRTRAYRAEVAPQRLEREPLLVDLPHGAHPALAEEWNGRAPALDGVLQQERRDRDRQRQEAPVHEDAKQGACEGDSGGIGLQGSLNVPLCVEFAEALIDPLRMACMPPYTLCDLLLDAPVHGCAGVQRHAVGRVGQHGGYPHLGENARPDGPGPYAAGRSRSSSPASASSKYHDDRRPIS